MGELSKDICFPEHQSFLYVNATFPFECSVSRCMFASAVICCQ